MGKCFVIQPFDRDKFDRRYVDIYEPAIIKAGLEPYRVDQDHAVRVPIDEIEKGIQSADFVFADITLDNPNVWYELGFAFAQKKDIVMVCCTDERENGFPFDIRHRTVVTYKTGSKSDFNNLENQIFDKITAYLSTARTVERLVNTPVNELEGLKSHEITLLLLLVENQSDPSDSVSAYVLRQSMEKAGFNSLATNVGLRVLDSTGFIEKISGYDQDSEMSYGGYNLTKKGEDWIMSNQHLMTFEKSTHTQKTNPALLEVKKLLS